MAGKQKQIKGRKVELWDKSFSVFNRKRQEYYYTGILWVKTTPSTEMIENFCLALDRAYEAGVTSMQKDIKKLLDL